jgi:indolepyruvate ferredoxin oxidoreductase beta subunit
MARDVSNVVIAGLGGQGVITASDVLAQAAFLAGYDVKKAEVHGMSQRGGSVKSDVRFGREVLSPMVARGDADYLVVLDRSQVEPHRHLLGPTSTLIAPEQIDAELLPSPRSLNLALLAVLSRSLPIGPEAFRAALSRILRPELFQVSWSLFERVRAQASGSVKPP